MKRTRIIDEDMLLPDDLEEENEPKQAITFRKLLLRFADGKDKALIAVGYSFAVLSGAGMPLLMYFTSSMMGSFTEGDEGSMNEINSLAFQNMMIGVFVFIVSYVCYVSLYIVAERIGKRTRVAYLRSLLQQEVAWFESSDKTVELSAKLS